MWIPRELHAALRRAANTRPAVVLTGCRQAGKTSLLVKAFSEHRYVSLDVPLVAEEAEHSGEDFLKRHRPPVFVDEVQYAPTLLRHVKADIDVHREETGSAAVALLDDLDSELDAERAGALCAEVAKRGQALVTSAHPGWAESLRPLGRVFHVEGGAVRCA